MSSREPEPCVRMVPAWTSLVPAPPSTTCAPIVLAPGTGLASALRILSRANQAMAFVAPGSGPSGVVTAEDLHFALEWAGPTGSVADAMTLGLVEVARDADAQRTTEAFAGGLFAWLAAKRQTS